MSEASHDNVNVRLNTHVNFYGPVIMIGSLSLSGVGLFFFTLWVSTHWGTAIMLSSLLVYGLLTIFGLSILSLVAWLMLKIVVHPWITVKERLMEANATAKERMMQANAQEWRNRLLYADTHFAVVVDSTGYPIVRPVFPAPPEIRTDPRSEKDVVLELHTANMGFKRIAEATGWTEYQVKQTCDEFDKKFNFQNANKVRKKQAASGENQFALSETHADAQ